MGWQVINPRPNRIGNSIRDGRRSRDIWHLANSFTGSREVGKTITEAKAERIVPGQSYGGHKQSGIGREYSLEGMLDSFTQRKSITINLQF